jgi:hypothetical protein
MSQETRAAVQQRQTRNGFGDIDGLQELINEMEPENNVSRATAGLISQEIKEAAYEARKLAVQSSYIIEAMGDKLHDIATRNGVSVDMIVTRMLQAQMEKTPAQLVSMSDEEMDAYLQRLDKLTLVAGRTAQASRHVKHERRETRRERAADAKAVESDEYRRRLAAKLAAIANDGADDE